LIIQSQPKIKGNFEMMRKELSETVAEIAGRPMTTIENGLIPKLQAAGLVSGEVDSTYRVNVLLGTILDRQHGVSPAEAVKHWRALPFTAAANEDLAQSFGIKTNNAGAALDSILETIGTWPSVPIAEAAARGDIHVAAEFHDDTTMVLVFHGPAKTVGTLNFGLPPVADQTGRVERIVRLLHRAFERLSLP
jgi:hypothetical protein